MLAKSSGADYDAAWTTPGATGASLPSQPGNAGKALTTDGTNASWDGFPITLPFTLAHKIDLAVGALTPVQRVKWPGAISEVVVLPTVNGGGGTIALKRDRSGTVTTLVSQVIPASSTTVIPIAPGSLAATDLAAGDKLYWECTAAVAGLQSVACPVYYKGSLA